MMVRIGIKLKTWMTIAAAPAIPPPKADRAAPATSKSVSYDIPRPGMATAIARVTEVMRATYWSQKWTAARNGVKLAGGAGGLIDTTASTKDYYQQKHE